MAASYEDVEGWKETAKEMGATHIISVCDTFDYDDYPIYVMPEEDISARARGITMESMQRINEIIEVNIMAATTADIEKGRQEREVRTNRTPAEVKESILEELTFDELREIIPEDEVDHFTLSVVIHQARKIVRRA